MKIVITSPVLHDGKPLEIGDAVDMPKAVAEALVAGGCALASGRAKAEAPSGPAADEAPAAE